MVESLRFAPDSPNPISGTININIVDEERRDEDIEIQ